MITNSRDIRDLRKSLKLSKKQKLFLVGTLLGDSTLLPNAWGKSYRLSIQHGASQKEYLFWKYKIFQKWVLSCPKHYVKTNSWHFRTISHPDFTNFAYNFYRKGKKILPKNIEEYLKEPFVVAVWYMDDGNIRKTGNKIYGAMLNTQSFSWEENTRLKDFLEEIYKVKILVLKDHNKPRLYISGCENTKKFFSVIKPHCLSCFDYKFS